MTLEELLGSPTLDPATLDLASAPRVTYLLEQTFRYDYTAPIARLRHRVVALPPARHGDQHLRARRLDAAVDGCAARAAVRRDARGNTVASLRAERVERSLQFRVSALVERVRSDGPLRLPAGVLDDPRLLRPTRLTAADDQVRELAGTLRGNPGEDAADLAARVCAAVHAALRYEWGVTSVDTTAAAALRGGRGVCQDCAHVMLALCHVLGLPARYVSGHLLGQGGTHAWVEVLVARDGHAVALPFDPCNGVATSARYVTIATGRDYGDVAPTSGSFFGAEPGTLSTQRRVSVLDAA